MEKTTWKLLKHLYHVGSMEKSAIDHFTGHDPKKEANPYTAYLRKAGYIEPRTVGGKVENGELISGVEFWDITLDGRDYIEKRRKDFWMFWLPYGITTIIALAALLR